MFFLVVIYSLRNKVKNFLNSLELIFIVTWNDLSKKLVAMYFLIMKIAKMRNSITSFRQEEDDSLFDVRMRIKEILGQCLHHENLIRLHFKDFYNGLVSSSRYMLLSYDGSLLSK